MRFPCNPNVHHRFYVAAATKAWDEGHRCVTLLCGEPDTIETDARTWYQDKREQRRREEKYDGCLVAEQLSDIEFTDMETGLEWIDMD